MKLSIKKSHWLLCIYAGLGFAFIAFMITLINPIIYDKVQEVRIIYENFEPQQIPPPEINYFAPSAESYPWGYYICFWGLLVFLAVFFAPHLLSIFNKRNNPYARCFYSVFMFLIIGIITMINFSFDAAYLVWVVAFGLVIGIIDAVHCSKVDISYVKNPDIPVDVKLQSLQSEYDKWFRGLTLFSAFVIAVGISGTIQSAVNTPIVVWNEVALLYSSILIYVGIGLGIGLYWEVIKRINSVTELIRTIN